MSTPGDRTDDARAREQSWAGPVSRLSVPEPPVGAINANVEGRQLVGALQGFGQLWQKTYRVRLSGVTATPREVVTVWKENFSKFWPPGNRFYPTLTGIAPGEVAVLNLSLAGPMKFSTGMLVMYADDESFALMTPQGNMEAGWITFSAFEEDGATVAQVQSIARASDPAYELSFLLFAHRVQEQFWHHTLTALAAHMGVAGQVQMQKTCLDPRRQWSHAKNIWYNAGIGTGLYFMMTPVRWTRRLAARRRVPR